jgi:hypothetical protein
MVESRNHAKVDESEKSGHDVRGVAFLRGRCISIAVSKNQVVSERAEDIIARFPATKSRKIGATNASSY